MPGASLGTNAGCCVCTCSPSLYVFMYSPIHVAMGCVLWTLAVQRCLCQPPPGQCVHVSGMFVDASVSYGPGMAVKGYVPCRAVKVYACQGFQLLGCAHIMVPAPLQAHPKCTAANVWALAP
jgi:hypothetical protein